MRTGSSSESPSAIVSSGSSSRSTSAFSSFCSSASSMPEAASSSKNSSSCSGLISSSTSKAALISSYVSEPWLLPARDQLLLEIFQRDRRLNGRCDLRPSYAPFSFAFTSFLTYVFILTSSSLQLRDERLELSAHLLRNRLSLRQPIVDKVGELPVPPALVFEPQSFDHSLQMRAPLLRVAVPDCRAAVAPARSQREGRAFPDPRQRVRIRRRSSSACRPLPRSFRRPGGRTHFESAPR